MDDDIVWSTVIVGLIVLAFIFITFTVVAVCKRLEASQAELREVYESSQHCQQNEGLEEGEK